MIHFYSVFNIQNRTRKYFCMNYIDNACMYKFLQDIYISLSLGIGNTEIPMTIKRSSVGQLTMLPAHYGVKNKPILMFLIQHPI